MFFKDPKLLNEIKINDEELEKERNRQAKKQHEAFMEIQKEPRIENWRHKQRLKAEALNQKKRESQLIEAPIEEEQPFTKRSLCLFILETSFLQSQGNYDGISDYDDIFNIEKEEENKWVTSNQQEDGSLKRHLEQEDRVKQDPVNFKKVKIADSIPAYQKIPDAVKEKWDKCNIYEDSFPDDNEIDMDHIPFVKVPIDARITIEGGEGFHDRKKIIFIFIKKLNSEKEIFESDCARLRIKLVNTYLVRVSTIATYNFVNPLIRQETFLTKDQKKQLIFFDGRPPLFDGYAVKKIYSTLERRKRAKIEDSYLPFYKK